MIDITVENFEAEVIAASATVPVLVDFWAPWCGPCQSLGPVLEALETEYAGRFVLAKVNSDEQPQVSQMFGVRSIPTCVLMVNGQPVDGFTGAQTEGQVREFLDKHVPAAEPELELEPEDDAAAALAAGDVDTALQKLQQAVLAAPDDDDVRFDYVKLLLQLQRDDEAKAAFAPAAPKVALSRKLAALKSWLDAIDFVAASARKQGDTADFDAQIAANKRDFEARFGRARVLLAQQQWTAAMDELLDILMRDKSWNDEAARKLYVSILEIIEPPKVKVADGQIPPQDPVVATYRRRLSSVVLS